MGEFGLPVTERHTSRRARFDVEIALRARRGRDLLANLQARSSFECDLQRLCAFLFNYMPSLSSDLTLVLC